MIAISDFFYLVAGIGKDCGMSDFIKEEEQYHQSTLVKVVDVVDVPDNFDLLHGWMEQPAPEHRGGSQSEDVPDDHSLYNYTSEEIETFYQLVTVYRKRNGQFIAVDCQGYDYWRYVYLSPYWREMFATESEQIRAECEAEQLAIIEAERKERQLQAKLYADRVDELSRRYPKLKKYPKGAAGITSNVKRWFAAEFPQYAVKVNTRPDYWGSEYYVSASLSRNIPESVRSEIYARAHIWKEQLPTGKYDEESRTMYDRPMRMYGEIAYGGLSIDFFRK